MSGQRERDGYDSDMNLCLTLTRQEKGTGQESEGRKEGLVDGREKEGPDDEEEIDRKRKGTGERKKQTEGRKEMVTVGHRMGENENKGWAMDTCEDGRIFFWVCGDVQDSNITLVRVRLSEGIMHHD